MFISPFSVLETDHMFVPLFFFIIYHDDYQLLCKEKLVQSCTSFSILEKHKCIKLFTMKLF